MDSPCLVYIFFFLFKFVVEGSSATVTPTSLTFYLDNIFTCDICFSFLNFREIVLGTILQYIEGC